jgi:hypothetical protein
MKNPELIKAHAKYLQGKEKKLVKTNNFLNANINF